MARWGRCDYRQLQDLQRRIEELQRADMDAFCRKMAKELTKKLLRKVSNRTPVDTGNLRREWSIGEIRRNGDSYEVEIINPVEYASYVEYGHRTGNHKGWVKGKFMLTVSEMELQAQAPAFLEKELYKYLKEELGW